jgi:integrase
MIINVKRSISKGQITTPKTSSSIRQVPVLNDIVPYLKNQITQAVENESEYLFCTKDGKHLNNANSLNLLRFLKSIGLHKRVHDTRHTFIVNMLNSNQIRTTDLAQIVGHANTQMIMTTYTRFIKGEHLSINRGISLYPNFRGTF